MSRESRTSCRVTFPRPGGNTAGAAEAAPLRRASTRPRGFTLIEVMVTLAVITTFAMVAYPTYMSYVLEAGRGDAYAALLDLATREESHFSKYNSYTGVIVAPTGCTNATCGLAAQDVSTDGYYALTAVAGRTRDLATSFVLTATARTGLRQEGDQACAVLSINWLGETEPAECW